MSSSAEEDVNADCPLADGVYDVKVKTDSSMFHLNETCDDMGVLTVEKGHMTVHITLNSKKIVNLYPGLKEEAQQDEANWLQPTMDEVTYSSGDREEVYGFDVPVPYLDADFSVAILGTKGNWYDHFVCVYTPE